MKQELLMDQGDQWEWKENGRILEAMLDEVGQPFVKVTITVEPITVEQYVRKLPEDERAEYLGV